MSESDPVARGFPLTRWSLVGRAAGRDTIGFEALDELLQLYRPALLAHLVHRKRLPIDDAEDLVQQFICEKAVRGRLLAHADQSRGRFRSYLLTVLDNFLASEWRRQASQKRRPPGGIKPLASADSVGGGREPDAGFEVAWTRSVLGEALARMEADCRRRGRLDVWEFFEQRLLRPLLRQEEATTHEALEHRHGLESRAQAWNLLANAKRTYARHLRHVVGQYARDPVEVEEELRDLQRLASSGGARMSRLVRNRNGRGYS